jgi:hypothetical protein
LNVTFKAPVVVAGTGGVTIKTGGATGGDIRFYPGGKIDFWDLSSSLIVGSKVYKLVGGVAELAAAVNVDHGGLYALAKDYDAGPDGMYPTSPVPTAFQGVFEGLGHTIANLVVNDRTTKCVGFFRKIGIKGTVRDIRLTNAAIALDLVRYSHEAVLAGCNTGTIANVYTDGTVKAWWVGGLAGYNEGLIEDSSSAANVQGKFAGGLVGLSEDEGDIVRSHASGSVVGDFVGKRQGIVIYAGGLAGVANRIEQSYATGPVLVHGKYYLKDRYSAGGGLVGHLIQGVVVDSYATGTVTGDRSSVLGGLVGLSDRGHTANSYATGVVIGEPDQRSAQGGAIGLVDGKSSTADAYWDIDTSGQAQGCGLGDCSGVTGLTDAQLRSGMPAGFDPAIWGVSPSLNGGDPYLLANRPQ